MFLDRGNLAVTVDRAVTVQAMQMVVVTEEMEATGGPAAAAVVVPEGTVVRSGASLQMFLESECWSPVVLPVVVVLAGYWPDSIR